LSPCVQQVGAECVPSSGAALTWPRERRPAEFAAVEACASEEPRAAAGGGRGAGGGGADEAARGARERCAGDEPGPARGDAAGGASGSDSDSAGLPPLQANSNRRAVEWRASASASESGSDSAGDEVRSQRSSGAPLDCRERRREAPMAAA